MQETVITCGDGGFFPVFVILIIIISIITNALKAAREKKEREERMKRSGGGAQPSSPPPYTVKKPKSASIEDFLRELSGAPPKKSPQKKETEWHAPRQDVEAYRVRKQREQREREEKRKRKIERKREERANIREKRKEALKRKKRQKQAAVSVADVIADRSVSARKRKAIQDAEIDAYHIKDIGDFDAYAIREKLAIEKVDITSMRKSDLRKAIVLKELLGTPVGLRSRNESVY